VLDQLPLQRGSRGEAVRDLQRRLQGLGSSLDGDESGVFGDGTDLALRTFQQQRGMRVDGRCTEESFSALVEASQTLGGRLLYYRNPMLRGDDVADLQKQLGALGFDAGRIDGIFGPMSRRALEDFQLNTALPVDGICGPSSLEMLLRVSGKVDGSDVVATVRERARLRATPRTLQNCRIVVGEPGGLPALALAVGRVLGRLGARVMIISNPDESTQAAQANADAADLYLGLRVDPGMSGCSTAYFCGHSGFRSEGGYRLAQILEESICDGLGLSRLGCRGMRVPVLRETRMPAVLVELSPVSVVVERSHEVAQAVGAGLERWANSPSGE
jgi:N-acetylmuramoyl-L-alanine amidase